MRKLLQVLGLGAFFFFVATTGRSATVITANTAINPLNLAYDGTDLVISNCTVTLNGPHGFNSLLIGSGGVLTHSGFGGGSSQLLVNVTNEPQTLNGTLPVTLFNTNVQGLVTVTDTNSVITYSNGVDYIQAAQPDGTTQIYATSGSAIPSNAVVFVSYVWAYSYSAGLFITLTNDLTVATNGFINANGVGYVFGTGPGHGTSGISSPVGGNGAGHGGNGGYSVNFSGTTGICYDSLYQPVNPGSGGGSSYAGGGASGGGLVQITSGGNVNIFGIISANGNSATNSRAGGGSGGSIWIIATNFNGTGSVTANGGAGELPYGGGGGGGRIALNCVSNFFAGTLVATGGAGWRDGGAGTVFTQVAGTNGLLVLDNGGLTNAFSSVNLSNVTDVIIRNGAAVQPSGAFLPNNLTIGANSALAGNLQVPFGFSVAGNLWIQSGGSLFVDGEGYSAGTGTAPGSALTTSGPPYPCGGGGHGGYGGYGGYGGFGPVAGGQSYDSPTAPVLFGSGGGGASSTFNDFGGPGGGALQLTVAGTLQVDGRLSANGGDAIGPNGGGGGAGGSIYIPNCGLLTGAGIISANGGAGLPALGGGGGGGGRIAIHATGNSFTGTITAYGGTGASYAGLPPNGGAGTIYTQFAQFPPQLVLDNGKISGANTPVSSVAANLIVQNGAWALGSGNLSFNSLLVASNSWLTHPPGNLVILTVSSATFQAGGGFIGDSLGHSGGIGYGAGSANANAPYYLCSGASYGGAGGNSASNAAVAVPYNGDTPAAPSATYSGSGGGTYSPSFGGTGGGFLQMTVSGPLQLDGLLTANGGNGAGPGGGGGAGGGIYLSVGSLAGAGAISVNGGTGAGVYGGGGGGGRIALYFNTNKFTGTLSASGGAGANYGGAGSIYFKTNSAINGQVIADNSGHSGNYTFWASSGNTDLTLRNGAGCFISGTPFFGNIIISSNSWLAVSNTQSAVVNLSAASLTIQPGGVVSADGAGYLLGSGSGLGGSSSVTPYYPGGGGGHGGGGGNSISNIVSGGIAFDTESSPGSVGGSGGGFIPNSTGGRGGGGLSLSLTGNLRVDGLLTANGMNGSGDGGGGGAGGAIRIGCIIMSGAGSIVANGGNGVGAIGGGGGGGMINAALVSNLFSGSITAYGGSGANYGAAGSIYFRTNLTGQTLLIVDNGGHRGGTNTPLASANNWVIRNGATAFAQNSGQSLNSLLIGTNGWLLSAATVNGSGLTLTVQGNATIQSGGGILGDGYGTLQNVGNGRGAQNGSSPYYQCSGAGHGGYGASVPNSSIFGGLAYDSSINPAFAGSGGGGFGNDSFGGNGGGFVHLTVSGTLLVNGSISVNGLNGTGLGGGGGSGGSLLLNGSAVAGPGIITGNGTISANGGSGAGNYGGGGGGGRIWVSFYSNSFSGPISAVGGGGCAYGGAGTIFVITNFQRYGLLLLDNGGNSGTNTTFDTTISDLTIQNGAIGSMPASRIWTGNSILIHTNGALTVPVTGTNYSLVASSLTIDRGGLITLDGAGNSSQTGAGQGGHPANTILGGGAGHGGYGGGNPAGSGIAYDSIVTPVLTGSGGGTYFNNGTTYFGGSGGGALQLTVNGTLTVNGRLSANGTGGAYAAGGGSGGSVYLANAGLLTGNGIISANGGSTNSASLGGGGGGGRIAIYAASNTFTGLLSAYGGYGPWPGGAGTVYTRIAGYQSLAINNGGLIGTNTPVGAGFSLPVPPFDLNISNAAVASAIPPLPIINNLNLGAGSAITIPFAQSNLFLAVKNNFNLAGNLIADDLGYPLSAGPGRGTNFSQTGSGGGYGGSGGNSAGGAVGGGTYGSASQPVDFGSGGGGGAYSGSTGSEGGGAIRMSVGGTLTLNGNLSANGDYAQQDNAGGGSGGSIWIAANTLSGLGAISAAGGNGDIYNGGGGGGGRIAIYSPTNLFAGTTNTSGGLGDNDGQPGTIFLSGTLLNFVAQSQSPTGIVNNTVSYVDVCFSDAIDPASVSGSAFTVTSPAGVIASGVSASATGLTSVRVSFPLQNLLGNYSIQVAPALTNILGEPLAAPYTGTFTISLPTLSGNVSDTNGNPVAGVFIQPTGGLIAATTDTNGNYSIGVPPGWIGTLTPSFATDMFVPGSLTYSNITTSVTNQNFLLIPTIAPALSASVTTGNLVFSWNGLAGVTYQIWSSPDLLNWTIYGSPIPGTNGTMQVSFPVTPGTPAQFFRLGASD